MTSIAILLLSALSAGTAEEPRLYGPVMQEDQQITDEVDGMTYRTDRIETWRAPDRQEPRLRWRGKKVRMRVPFGS